MSESDKVFAGSVPENYDRYLVPLIFESFAQADESTNRLYGGLTMLLRDRLPTVASAGAKQMHRRCRSKMLPSTSFVASLGSCSSPTGS